MPREKSPGKPTTRRYTELEKDQTVRLVRRLREELGSEHGTVQRVAEQLEPAYGAPGPNSCSDLYFAVFPSENAP